MTSVKWLRRIHVLDRPFDGYQNERGYRWKTEDEEAGTPVERIRVRSLMVPPGFPTFLPRTRNLGPGPVTLQGRAWSGAGPVTRVEVSTDDARTWADAAVEGAPGPHAWQRWTFEWDAAPGEHVLASRATDATGDAQPIRPEWNVGGYTNNAIQLVPVSVR
jgi:DMSO/TMAO reductase YedYZ molybdopterin-dependent catalytic subunit